MVGGQTSRKWVVRGCVDRRTDGWDVSQQFLCRSKYRRLRLEPNSFGDGRRTDAWDSIRLGLEPNSFSVGRRTYVWYSSWIGLEPNSFTVGRQTDVWDSIRLGLESINSFGHILYKEVSCLTVLGTRKLTTMVINIIFVLFHIFCVGICCKLIPNWIKWSTGMIQIWEISHPNTKQTWNTSLRSI